MPDKKGFLITVSLNVVITLLLLLLVGLCYRVEMDTVKGSRHRARRLEV